MAKTPTSNAVTTSEARTSNSHRGAEQNGGRSDPVLDARNRHAHEPEHSAHRHDQRKRNRQHPDGGGAKLRAPQANGDHRQHVVQSRDRMKKSGQKTGGLALLHMRVCRGGPEGDKNHDTGCEMRDTRFEIRMRYGMRDARCEISYPVSRITDLSASRIPHPTSDSSLILISRVLRTILPNRAVLQFHTLNELVEFST